MCNDLVFQFGTTAVGVTSIATRSFSVKVKKCYQSTNWRYQHYSFFVGYTIQLRLWKQGANWLRSIFFRSIRYRDCQNIQLRRRLPSFWTRSDNMFPVKNINKKFHGTCFCLHFTKGGKKTTAGCVCQLMLRLTWRYLVRLPRVPPR